MTCPGAFNGRGSQQLVQLSRQALGGRQLAPTILHISIEATNQAWINALSFMSTVEELIIDSVRPSSLEAKVFRSLIVWPTLRGRWVPLCPSLKRLRLKYRRWLRQNERFGLIPDLVYVIKSRERSNYTSLQSLSIWMTSNQEGPLELIEGSQLSQKGLWLLADESGINEDLFELIGDYGVCSGCIKVFHGALKRYRRICSSVHTMRPEYRVQYIYTFHQGLSQGLSIPSLHPEQGLPKLALYMTSQIDRSYQDSSEVTSLVSSGRRWTVSKHFRTRGSEFTSLGRRYRDVEPRASRDPEREAQCIDQWYGSFWDITEK